MLGVGGMAAAALGAFALSHSNSASATTSTPFIINVQDYGAVGDGTTDDSAAIQAALNAAAGLCACFFPNTGSQCIISLTINVPSNSTIFLFGTVKLATHSNRDMLSLGSNVSITGTGTLDGNRANQNPTPTQGCAGIGTYMVSNIYIGGIMVTNCYLWSVNIVATSHATLENCTFNNSGSSVEFAQGSSRCWAVGCRISGIADEGFAFYGGVVDSGITRCTVYGSTAASGISVLNDSAQIAACQRISISHNNCYGNWLAGIDVATGPGATAAHHDINITGNILHGNALIPGGYRGVGFNNAVGLVIANNQIFNDGNGSANNGLCIGASCKRFTISGNDVHNEGQGSTNGIGIYVVNGASRLVFIGNQVYDDQTPKTMVYALGGTATSGVIAMNAVLGPSYLAPLGLPTGTNVFINNQILP